MVPFSRTFPPTQCPEKETGKIALAHNTGISCRRVLSNSCRHCAATCPLSARQPPRCGWRRSLLLPRRPLSFRLPNTCPQSPGCTPSHTNSLCGAGPRRSEQHDVRVDWAECFSSAFLRGFMKKNSNHTLSPCKMVKLSRTETMSLIARLQHSQLQNMMHGTPVASPAQIIAQQQDKTRQWMAGQRAQKNGYVPQIMF